MNDASEPNRGGLLAGASGTVKIVFAILKLAAEYGPSIFTGIGGLITDIEQASASTPITMDTIEAKAKAHNVDLGAVHQWAETHIGSALEEYDD